jgi:hypothetical protein
MVNHPSIFEKFTCYWCMSTMPSSNQFNISGSNTCDREDDLLVRASGIPTFTKVPTETVVKADQLWHILAKLAPALVT